MNDARYWIEKLRLEPHPEGGYFRQTYKSELRVSAEGFGDPTTGASEASQDQDSRPLAKDPRRVKHAAEVFGTRAASTGIYFLLEGKNFSAFHRLRSDEMWHFYAGAPLVVHVIDPAGNYSSIQLGNDAEAGQVFQAVVRAGCWFGSRLAENPHFWQNRPEVGHPYALVGCTVAPGFEFEDFELARRGELEGKYPQHSDIIRRLTR